MDLENPLESPLTSLLAASGAPGPFCDSADKNGPAASAAVPQQQYMHKELPALSCQAVQGSNSEAPPMPRRTLVLDLSQVPGDPSIQNSQDVPTTSAAPTAAPAGALTPTPVATGASPVPTAADIAVPDPFMPAAAAALSLDCCADQQHQQHHQKQPGPGGGNNNHNRAASPQFAQAVKTTKDLSVVKAEAHMDDRELVDLFCHWTTDGFDTPDFEVLTASREAEIRALVPCPPSAAAAAAGTALLQPQHTAELLFTGKPEVELPMLQVPQRSVPLLLDLRSPAASDVINNPSFPPVQGFPPNQQPQQQQQQQASWAGASVQGLPVSPAMDTTPYHHHHQQQQQQQQQQATPQGCVGVVTQVAANPAPAMISNAGPQMTPGATTAPQLFAPLADIHSSPVICGIRQGSGGGLLLASPLVALPGAAGMRLISLSPAAVPPVSPDTQTTLLTDQQAAYLHIGSDQQNRELSGSCFNCQSGGLVVGPVCGTSIGPVCGPACAPVSTAAAAAISGPNSNHGSEILLDPSMEDSLDVCEWFEGSSTAANPLLGSATGSTPIGTIATAASDAQLDASGTELAVPTAAAAAAALTAALSVQDFTDMQPGSTAGAAAVQLQYKQAVPQCSGFQTWQGAAQYDQVNLQHQQQQQQQVQMQPSPECLVPYAYQPGMQQQYQQHFVDGYAAAALPTVPSITPAWDAAAAAAAPATVNAFAKSGSEFLKQSFSGFVPQQVTGMLQMKSSWVPKHGGMAGTAGAAAEPAAAAAAAAGGYYAPPHNGFVQGGLDVSATPHNSGQFAGQQCRTGTAQYSTGRGAGSSAGGSTGGRAAKAKGNGKASKGSTSASRGGTASFHQKRKAAALAAAGAAAFGTAFPVAAAAAAGSGSIAAGRPQRKAAQLGLEKIHAYCKDTYKDLSEDPLALSERLPVPEQYSRHKQQQLGSASAPWLSGTAVASSSPALFDASCGPSGLQSNGTLTAVGSTAGQAASSNGMYPFTAYSENSLLLQNGLGQVQNGCQPTGSPVLPGAQQYNEFCQARISIGGTVIVQPTGGIACTPAVNNNAGQGYGAVHSTAAASLSGGGLSAGLSAGGSSSGGASGGGAGMAAVQLQDKQYRVSDHARANNSGVQGILDLSGSPMQQAGKAAAAAAAEAACAVKRYAAEGAGGVGLSVHAAAAAAAAAPVLCSRDVLLMVFAAQQNQVTTVSAAAGSTLTKGTAHIVTAASATPSMTALAAAAATADAAVAVMSAVRRSERRRHCAGIEPLTEPQAALALPAAATAAAGVPSVAVTRPAVAAEGTGMLQADSGSPASAAALPDDCSDHVTIPKCLSVPAVVPQANGSNLRVRFRGAKRHQQLMVGDESETAVARPVKRQVLSMSS